MNQTSIQYQQVIAQCRAIFEKKNHDYGPSWRIMRVSSITDQIFIKATRIRTLEEKGVQKIDEGVEPEWMGIINYCIMALIQLDESRKDKDLSESDLLTQYDSLVQTTHDLMEQKNHDYGEIWRSMLVSTFTDMLLMRVNRIHQIIELEGNTLASEGIESNFMDMINYSVFALIRLNEKNKK
ncbi:MAG: DUF1599 domain-containing protein [Bacteroidia bacterium]|nr:DUF1599 domain-containing protein [Bacteroidia bacterium]MCF8426828.1 DUF1599 domain-containing protein [Bacteroidia bacterium]MCF8446804.1 DUF1599 domain-containing protein [Bacteroidia bacterium]